MGCTKCGTDLSSLHLIVKDIIRQLIDEGKLQEGLVDCTDKRLWRDSRVLTCDLLGDAVCQLITNGDICLVKPEALTVEKQENGSHKISLLMSDGTVLDTTARLADGVLNSVTYDAKTKIAKFTTTNGDSYEIKLDIPEPVEYTFTKKDDGVYSVAKDGKELLAINPGVLDVKIEGDKLHVTNAAGEVKQFDIPMPTVAPCARAKDLDGLDAHEGTLKKLGITCFYGKFNKEDESTAHGAPVQLGKTDVESSEAIANEQQVPEGVDIDFNGWQIATDAEITQYLYTATTDGKQSGWTRSNESGMNPDGSVKDVNAWSNWMYELNLPSKPILVSTAGAIEGDGSTTNPIKLEFNDTIVKGPDNKYGADIKVKAVKEADGKVVITNQDGTTVEIEKSAPATAGLDCAAIDELPEKPWKKGTVILAKQDGECVRLVALDSIFQEVGVGITADKTNGLVSDNYKVVVTVSNTGEGKNELTNLNIVGPANTEDYEIKDVTFTKSEADEVEQVDNLTYIIRGLKKGGTVKVKYTVVPKVKGTYQFTAAVNPNSPLDKDLGNNNATIILRSDTASKAITGENCPAIEVREKDTSVLLTQVSGGLNTNSGIVQVPVEYRDIVRLEYPNIFSNRTTLKGLVLTCNTAVTAVARGLNVDGKNANEQRLGTGFGFGTDDGSIYSELVEDAGTASNSYLQLNPDATHIRTTNSISVTGNEITITEDVTELTLLMRPRGASCYWQAYLLFSATAPKTESIKVTNVVGGVLTTVKTPKVKLNGTYKVNTTTSGVTELSSISGGYVEKQVVTVKKGTAATASVDFGKFNKFYSSGLVEITANSLTVSADATPSDSIRSTYLDVIIEE